MVFSRAARRWAIALGLPGIALVGVLGCTGSSGELMNSTSDDPPEVPPWSCVPGETQPCPCADGLEGLMTCDAQGAGFGECDCSPGAVSQGPPPTSTGSGSETGSETAGTGDTTVDATSGSSSGPPDPSTTSGSSSGVVDPSTTGASSSGTGSSG